MGERQKRKALFKSKHPYCCYCGGGASTETIDHVPSKQMFKGKRRPKGLEVPACYLCNQKTKNAEQVAAYLGRIYPDPESVEEKDEIVRISTAISNNCAGLIEEMWPSPKQVADFYGSNTVAKLGVHPLNAGGPLLNEYIQLFGVKLGLALHYQVTDRIVPASGAVAVRWFSNEENMSGAIPDGVRRVLGDKGSVKTLSMGKQNVGDQFVYNSEWVEDGTASVHVCAFRQSFLITSFVYENAKKCRQLRAR